MYPTLTDMYIKEMELLLELVQSRTKQYKGKVTLKSPWKPKDTTDLNIARRN